MHFFWLVCLQIMLLFNITIGATHQISIINLAFVPQTDTIALGDTVKWTNNASATPHTTTSNTGVWNSGTLNHGQSFSFHFTSNGSFPYHCDFHPSMTATIVVQASDVKDETGNNGRPTEFILSQNYPNPFNQSTKIEFTLAHSGFVSLNIYDLLGRKVKTLVSENLSSGYKSVLWDGRNDSGEEVASGIYFYRMKVEKLTFGRLGDFCNTKKLLLLK